MNASADRDRGNAARSAAGHGKPGAGRKSAAQRRKQAEQAQRRDEKPAGETQPADDSVGVRAAPRGDCLRIGVISDTHGFMDPAVLDIFAGVDLIIHAGDIVDPHIIAALADVAPVVAVSGNIDTGDLASTLPRELVGEAGGVRYVVGHKRKPLLKRLAAGKFAAGPDGTPPDVVIFGHEHVPAALWVDGTLLLNPGTASSPDEEDDGPTVAILESEPTGLSVRFVPLRRREGEQDRE